jgi:hypothetical protein
MIEIDCHSEMTAYHAEEVTLSRTQQTDMRQRRDNGRTRLENGLNTMGKPLPQEIRSQGSYQMRTMVQDPENDYDIDDGVYFVETGLEDDAGAPLTPKDARQRICDALAWDGRFRVPAEVKGNCVRQAYAIGYHIDMPVYRIVKEQDWTGTITETFYLASGDSWVLSDARKVTQWFNNLVGDLNAGQTDGSQMRRVTKLSKKFARRDGWKEQTTSGITITKLIVDNFSSSPDRDDEALRETWKKIQSSLQWSTKVRHPVNPNNLAEAGDAQVTFFRDCITDALNELSILDQPQCTRTEARKAWDKVFDTSYFSNRPYPNDGAKNSTATTVMNVTSEDTARRNDGGGRFG